VRALHVLVPRLVHARANLREMRFGTAVRLAGYAMFSAYLALWAAGFLHWLWVESFGTALLLALVETGEKRWSH
jgi:hypothetical protein